MKHKNFVTLNFDSHIPYRYSKALKSIDSNKLLGSKSIGKLKGFSAENGVFCEKNRKIGRKKDASKPFAQSQFLPFFKE